MNNKKFNGLFNILVIIIAIMLAACFTSSGAGPWTATVRIENGGTFSGSGSSY